MEIPSLKDDITLEHADVDENNDEHGDSSSSFTSITSITLTASSQLSQRSDYKLNLDNKNKQHGEFDDLIKEIKNHLDTLDCELSDKSRFDTKNVTNLINEVTEKYNQKIADLKSSHKAIVEEQKEKLADLKLENAEKDLQIKQLTKNCTDAKILKDANDTLNQYISKTDEYHYKEVGVLKAKLSLTRIEKEINEKLANKDENMNITEKPKNKSKKRRRSSVMFWKRSSANSLNEQTPSTSSKRDESPFILSENIKDEVESKCIKLEELNVICNDLQSLSSLQQITLQNKDIDINKKRNRIYELQNEIKNLSLQGSKSCDLLNEIDKVLKATTKEVSFLEMECKSQRQLLKNYCKLLNKLDWNIKSLNEENKIVLYKVNKKTYDLNVERLKTDTIVNEMKLFLTKFIEKFDSNVNAEAEFKKYGLKKLIEISTQLTQDVTKPKSDGLSTPDCNTTPLPPPSEIPSLPEIPPAPELPPTPELPPPLEYQDDKSIQTETNIIFAEEKESINLPTRINEGSQTEYPLHHRQTFNTDDTSDNSLLNVSGPSFSSNYVNLDNVRSSDFFGELVTYVENQKNREIDSYKEDITRLEMANYELERSLNDSHTEIKSLKIKLEYQQHKQDNNSYVSKSLHDDKTYFEKINKFRKPVYHKHRPINRSNTDSKLFTGIEKYHQKVYSHSSPKLQSHNTGYDMTYEKKDDVTSDSSTFLHSYEVGSSLINEVFKKKDQLEQELEQSREIIRGRRKPIVRKTK